VSLLLLDVPQPPVLPVVPFVSGFAARVAAMDRRVLTVLGGTPVVYQPAVGVAVPVSGVFDQLYVLAQGTAPAGVGTIGPAVWLLLADLPIDPELDEPTITIDSLAYRVTARERDGMGGIVLGLRLVT
jgi:hypothetical protein